MQTSGVTNRSGVAPAVWTGAAAAGLRTLAIEVDGLKTLAASLSEPGLGTAFEKAVHLIAATRGRVIVTGMGKSGLIGRKWAATLASTGTPSFYIHPADAGHGDLGMITHEDVIVALSWSGETTELTTIVEYCRRFRVRIIGVTARSHSTLAQNADLALILPPVQEACPHDLAPTTSTTVQAAFGDALAVALIQLRDFTPEQFQLFHPKGRLGARLLHVGDIMSSGDAIPQVNHRATIAEAMIEMSRKRLGVTGVLDDAGRLIGAFTDGDLRRSLTGASVEEPVAAYMTLNPLAVDQAMLASEALALMNEHNISQIFALDEQNLAGVMHLHDALRAAIA